MSEKKYTTEDCLALLCAQYARLREAGEERYPQRADFEEAAVVAIKAHLGPWPRALEAAGIKPRDKAAVKAYFDEKKRLAEEKQKAEAAEAEEAKRREREANPTTEDLLKLILAEMKQQNR